MKVSQIFIEEPMQWGLRGDAFLWSELKMRLKDVQMPETSDELHQLILAEYESATGHSFTHLEPFYIERFSHGGMSSGTVSPEFWRDRGLPLLLSRFVE